MGNVSTTELNKIKKERDAFKKAATALWSALRHFSAYELQQKPDHFHDLIVLADKECKPYRKAKKKLTI